MKNRYQWKVKSVFFWVQNVWRIKVLLVFQHLIFYEFFVFSNTYVCRRVDEDYPHQRHQYISWINIKHTFEIDFVFLIYIWKVNETEISAVAFGNFAPIKQKQKLSLTLSEWVYQKFCKIISNYSHFNLLCCQVFFLLLFTHAICRTAIHLRWWKQKRKIGWKFNEYDVFWLHIIITCVRVQICIAFDIWGWPNF